MGRRLVVDSDVGDGRRRLCGYLRRGLRNRSVSDVTDLAMVFIVGVVVPVADRMRRERGQRQDDCYCQ
jgi:hypothetical protein